MRYAPALFQDAVRLPPVRATAAVNLAASRMIPLRLSTRLNRSAKSSRLRGFGFIVTTFLYWNQRLSRCRRQCNVASSDSLLAPTIKPPVDCDPLSKQA